MDPNEMLDNYYESFYMKGLFDLLESPNQLSCTSKPMELFDRKRTV